jgi:hypothetical protein
MADVTPTTIRGFLVPYRLTQKHFWTSESTITQNGDLAGLPQSEKESALTLTAQGKQSKNIQIQTYRAGNIQEGAGFVWNEEGDPLRYGMEVPSKITDIQSLKQESAFATYQPHDSLLLSSGETVISYRRVEAGVTSIEAGVLDVEGNFSGTNVDSVNTASLAGNERFSCLCLMPDKSILLAMWSVDAVQNLANIIIYRSEDNASSWTLVSSKALPEDFDVSGAFGAGNSGFELQRLTMAATSNQVLLFAAVNAHDTSVNRASLIYQYASTSAGLIYQFIGKTPTGGTVHFYMPNVVSFNETFIVSYYSSVDTLDFTRFQNAFDWIEETLAATPSNTLSGVFATVTNNRLTGGTKSMHADFDGRLWVYVGHSTTGQKVYGAFSDMAGVGVEKYALSWSILNDNTVTGTSNFASNDPVIDCQSPSGYIGGIINLCSSSGGGSQLLFCNWNNVGTNPLDDGVHMITMGHWATQQYPKRRQFALDRTWACNDTDWIPTDLPTQGTSWAKTSTGAASETLGGDHITLSASNADVIYYKQTTLDKSNGLIIHTKITNISGTSATRGVGFGCQIQTKTTTATYHFDVITTNNAIYLYDEHAGAAVVGSATGLSYPDGFSILLNLDNSNGKITLYHANGAGPKQYQKITGTLTTDPNTTTQLYWGIPTSTGTATPRVGDFHFFSFGEGSSNGIGFFDGTINARQYAGRGFYTQLSSGLSISTLNGPAREGDIYNISPQYGSPIERSLHVNSPSPHVGWRSNAVSNPDTTNVPLESIAWMMDTTLKGTANTKSSCDAVGVHLTGINFRQFDIQKYMAGVGWQTITSVDNSIGGSFNFTREGASIRSDAVNGTYLHSNECRGWYLVMINGATNIVRKIAYNSDGVLANTSSKRARIQLQDVKSSDPANGTAYLIPSKCTVLFNDSEFAALRISIPAQRTNEGFFKIGTMVMGDLVVPASQYGRGRTVAFQASNIETDFPSGTLYSQKNGEGGRTIRISWTDGVDTSPLFETNSNPDYWELDPASTAISAMGSAPTLMMGLVQYINGSRDAVVYLPSIQTNTGSPRVLNRYHSHMLATFGNEIQIDHVLGDELQSSNKGEVFRVSTIIMREVR